MKNNQEVIYSPYRININKFAHGTIIVKLQTTKNNILDLPGEKGLIVFKGKTNSWLLNSYSRSSGILSSEHWKTKCQPEIV